MKKDILTEIKEKTKSEGKIKKELGCKSIRTNPDEKDSEEYVKFAEINNHISVSNKAPTRKPTKKVFNRRSYKKPLKKLSQNKLKFEENYSIKSNFLKFIVKKILPSLWTMQTYSSSKRKEGKKQVILVQEKKTCELIV